MNTRLRERMGEVERERDRLAAERKALLNVKTKEGLLASEWLSRTALAEADRDRLQQDYRLLVDDYKQAQIQVTRLQQRVDKLEKRLEVDHAYRLIPDTQETERVEIPSGERDKFPDAVSCRDATIELMEDHIKKLQQRVAEVEGFWRQALKETLLLAKISEACYAARQAREGDK